MALPRLKQRREFLAVAASGHRAVAPGLVLQAKRRGDADPSIRVGFTASRRVGGAVARNRARRRLRALADEVLPRHAEPGSDYVVIARAAARRRPFALLRRDLEGALRRCRFHRGSDQAVPTARRTV